MPFRAYINDQAEINFLNIKDAAAWQKWKETNKGTPILISKDEGHTTEKPRTAQQNRALHKYFELVAEALNDAGYPIQKTLSRYKAEIDWSKESVKELIWRPLQKALLGKTSTADLSKQDEITAVYEHVNRFLAKMGVHVAFPSMPPGYYDTAPMKGDS